MPQDEREQVPQAVPADVQRAVEALLTLVAELDELDLADVEPAFVSLEWPS